MATRELYRGRLIDHVHLVVNDIEASRKFYGAVLEVLGIPIGGQEPDFSLEAGGKDNGAPGERPYHPGYYAAFVEDRDGNNIEAVFHGAANRSSAAVKITF